MAQVTSGGGWRVKPMDLILSQAEEPAHKLKRAMGTISLTAFGVAAIIGSGIFVLTGVAAAGACVAGAGAGVCCAAAIWALTRANARNVVVLKSFVIS